MNAALPRPSIAVVVLSYNRPDTLATALKSIADQPALSERVADVYLADDRSPGSIAQDAVSSWSARVPLALLSPPANVGQWRNANQALLQLAGRYDWVLILHDDDIAKPEWVARTAAAIDGAADNIASICSSWDVLRPDGRVEPGEDAVREIEVIAGDGPAINGTLRRGCWWHFSGAAIRTRAFTDVGGFNPEYAHGGDQEWLIRALDRGWHIAYIPRTLLLYRIHEASVSARQFAVHQDLREQLWLVRRFGRTLSTREALTFHLRLLRWLSRRTGAAVIRRRLRSASTAVGLMSQVAASLVTHVAMRRHT